jgi:hypothetical protein
MSSEKLGFTRIVSQVNARKVNLCTADFVKGKELSGLEGRKEYAYLYLLQKNLCRPQSSC